MKMNIHIPNFKGELKIFCQFQLTVQVPVDGTQESIMLLHMGLSMTSAA